MPSVRSLPVLLLDGCGILLQVELIREMLACLCHYLYLVLDNFLLPMNVKFESSGPLKWLVNLNLSTHPVTTASRSVTTTHLQTKDDNSLKPCRGVIVKRPSGTQ